MRKIIHVDMDCFYAAVEEKHNPSLKGKPVGIGGPPDSRSVLCTANYEARRFGVKAAIPSSQAVRLCPHLILIPPHFDLYRQESLKIRQILEQFSSKIEPLSLDEAYLDVSGSSHFQGSATLIAKEIKRRVREEVGLTISAGVAPNKFLAKVASDWKKPDGLFTIAPEQVKDFVQRLPVEKIFGVGKVTAARLHELGIRTCGDILHFPETELIKHFGSRAPELHRYAMGIDEREVHTDFERKSVSVEETFNQDRATLAEALKEVPALYEDWLQRMIRGSYMPRIKGLQVKLKFADFSQTTLEQAFFSPSLTRLTSSDGVPSKKDFESLLKRAWERRCEPIRLLGIGCKLKSTEPKETSKSLKASGEVSSSCQLEFLAS
jgi:DNA polymerase-4